MSLVLTTLAPLVQSETLQRYFLDALNPKQLFRKEARREPFPFNLGQTHVFTREGLLDVDMTAMSPGADPVDANVSTEAWEVTASKYARSVSIDETTRAVAIASIGARRARTLGINAGMTINRLTRAALFMAYESGQTLITAGAGPTTAVPVLNINGFTTYLQNGRQTAVSVTNPMPVHLYDTGAVAYVARNVTACVPTVAGATSGPGTLTIDANATFATRGIIYSDACPYVHRVGGGLGIDAITSTDILTLAECTAATASLKDANVPPHDDGTYHVHVTATEWAQLSKDSGFLQAIRAPTGHPYLANLAYGVWGDMMFVQNTENPRTGTYSASDPVATLEFATLGGGAGTIPIQRAIVTGGGALVEMFLPGEQTLSSAGVTGKLGDFEITANGINIITDGVKLIMRAPVNKLQDVSTFSWKFCGGWGVPTDQTAGAAAMFKRAVVIQHA